MKDITIKFLESEEDLERLQEKRYSPRLSE